MKLKEANPASLPRQERACVRLAQIARADTIWGGARALVIADRLEGLQRFSDQQFNGIPAREIVGDVYSASNYTLAGWGAYECPECGTVHLGADNAMRCCAINEEEP